MATKIKKELKWQHNFASLKNTINFYAKNLTKQAD